MSYLQYKTIKSMYSDLCKPVSDEQQSGGDNKYCNLPKNAKIYFGSGGSDGIIAVLEDRAYKYFPLFIRPRDNAKKIKEKNDNNKYEIAVIKELTKRIIKPKLSPHIIEFYANHRCDKIPSNIFKDCPSIADYLLKPSIEQKSKCDLIFDKGYPRKLYKPMHVIEFEKGDGTLNDEIVRISKKKWDLIETFLNRLFFQVFFTLESIKLVFPDYQHNDLFIRNILTMKTNYQDDQYIRYNYNYQEQYTFDLPASGLYIKLNDFGMNELNKKLSKRYFNDVFISNRYRDYFSIIYDVYNGGNHGGSSLYKLIKNNDKIKKIDKYFGKFLNVKTIKKIIKNNKKRHLDWDWEKTLDNDVVNLLGIKEPDEYLKHFIKIFPYDKNHNIIEEYGISK